jgi:transposase InsO family protein
MGYDYVHSMVDDRSRLAYSEIPPDEKGATCTGFIARAADYFAAHGILAIERVMTDNHWSYRRSADVPPVIATLGAKHKFIKPHCPWQSGKVERFNRTLRPFEVARGRRSVPRVIGRGRSEVRSGPLSVGRSIVGGHRSPA